MSKQKSMISVVRSYNIRIRLIIAAVLLFICVVLCIGLLPKTTKYFLAGKNIFAQPYTRIGDDQFYQGKTQYMYTWFADNDKGRFYLAPMEDANGNAAYIIVYVPNKYIDVADELVEQTHAYEKTGDMNEITKTISCRGYTTEPSSQIRRFLDQYFTAIEATNDIRENLCDYMFVMVPATDVLFGDSGTCFYLLMILFCLGFAVFFVITAASGSYLRKFKKNLAAKNISLDELNADLENAATISRLYVGHKYLVEATMTPTIRNMEDIVWLYPQRTNANGNNTTYSVMAYTRYHEGLRYAVHSMDEAEQLCRHILKTQPRALYGYVIENSTMYYSHFNELIDRVYNQADAMPQEQTQENLAADPAASQVSSIEHLQPPALSQEPQSPLPSQPAEDAKENTSDHGNDILYPGI